MEIAIMLKIQLCKHASQLFLLFIVFVAQFQA